ncbi:hypothetical protein MHYP_G00296600 [Metynnis hypsauchen]
MQTDDPFGTPHGRRAGRRCLRRAQVVLEEREGKGHAEFSMMGMSDGCRAGGSVAGSCSFLCWLTGLTAPLPAAPPSGLYGRAVGMQEKRQRVKSLIAGHPPDQVNGGACPGLP